MPHLIAIFSVLLIASASSASVVYKAACTGAQVVPPITTKASGSVSITIVNSSYATGYFYATNINQMTMAHLHAGAVGSNGPVIAWAYNATYGPISGSIKASFAFNPSSNNISSLLSLGLVYFNIHTTAHPTGELRGQLPFDFDPQACNMSMPKPVYPAPLNYIPFAVGLPNGRVGRDTIFAMKCFNSIRINRTLALQHISSLSAYFKEFYVFQDIAKNPADPNATPRDPLPSELNVSVYSGKADLEADFQALIQSLDPTQSSATVPLGDFYFGISSILTGARLRDEHVSNALNFTFRGLMDERSSYFSLYQNGGSRNGYAGVSVTRNGTFVDHLTNKTISMINGVKPIQFFSTLVSDGIWSSNDKSLGASLNNFFNTMTSNKNMMLIPLFEVPNIKDFYGKAFSVIYSGEIDLLQLLLLFFCLFNLSHNSSLIPLFSLHRWFKYHLVPMCLFRSLKRPDFLSLFAQGAWCDCVQTRPWLHHSDGSCQQVRRH